MRRHNALVLAIATPIVFSGCDSVLDLPDDRVVGSGVVVTQERRIDGVFGVDLSGVGFLVIEHGSRERLTVTTDDNILPYLVSEVRGGRLVLGTAPQANISPSRGIEYRLTVRALDEIVVSGAGQVEAYDIDTEFLHVAISGAAGVMAEGIADEQHLAISGAGRYTGRWLTTLVTTADVSGASHALVRVRDLLEASVSGASVLEYIGRPIVRGTVSGVGTIVGIDE